MSDENQPDKDQPTEFDGALPENWRDGLPEDLKTSGVLESVNNIEQIAKMAVDGRKLASNAVRIPSDDASEEDRKTFQDDLLTKLPGLMVKPDIDNDDSVKQVLKSLGMPETVEGYELKDIPEPLTDNFNNLAKTAHDAGLTKKQLEAITTGIITDFQTNSDTVRGQVEAQVGELKQEWGAAYDNKVKTISHFAEQTGFTDDLIDAIESGQLSPANMKAFDSVVKGFQGEGIEIGKQPNDVRATMTPQEADTRLNELMGNKDHAYWHPEDPEHSAAVKKVVELGKLAEAGQKSDSEKFKETLLGA